MKPRFFATPQAFRRWLERRHDKQTELLVGFYKVGSGKPSLTWPESVDQALCFGWIDGVRRSIDNDSYTIRFTPRKARSNWSAKNIKRMRELIEQQLVHLAGIAAFEQLDEKRTNRYSFEREEVELDVACLKEFRTHERAWAFFQSQPPSYRKVALWWIVSAKQEATRRKRLATLIEDSAAGLRLKALRRT